MTKIYPSDLIKLIQKELDNTDLETHSFLVIGLKGPLKDFCLTLKYNKLPSFGKNVNNRDFARLISNLNHAIIFISKIEELGSHKEDLGQRIFQIDYSKDEVKEKMKTTFK